ncbi:hypothetical protein BDZ89DRAFT_974678 [Hymenopellis radicata]|nr:hypothetical protein BDZ89DRAFT_974678 [Hymenopellis radicata]
MAQLTGYYRWTDIWFNWREQPFFLWYTLPSNLEVDRSEAVSAVNPGDGPKVKSMLAHDALVDVEHPLHPGVAEVELFIGILLNGESRLLFSSKQVDYLRLHAMQITTTRVPLPYSNCLLLSSELKAISPVYFKTGAELRNAIKVIWKNNKRLKGLDARPATSLTACHDVFECVRGLYSQKNASWVAIDFEEWEHDRTVITELGVCAIHWEGSREVSEDAHYMISVRDYRNGTYVADNRTNYNFGDSEIIPRNGFLKVITDTFERLSAYGPLFLVFHDATGDLKTLEHIGVPTRSLSPLLPDRVPVAGMFVVDTSALFTTLVGDASFKRHKLERVCHLLRIPKVTHLHNAGNDAHFTLEALKSMVSGAPADVQRGERWPEHIDRGGGF